MPSLERNLPLYSFAPAKINLTLHVRGRRSDGYHDLESLVVFASEGDGVTLLPGAELSLAVSGPTARNLDDGGENLIVKAVRALMRRKKGLMVGAFRLDKRLPIASGIGGGSADAAAALRLVAQVNDLPLTDSDLQAAALETGADVPVCLEMRARVMGGIGEELGEPLDLLKMPAVLVNPGLSVSTPEVFKMLGLKKGQAFRSGPAFRPPEVSGLEPMAALLRDEGHNDLEGPAIAVQPEIRKALDALSSTTDCLLARMSGSGATVFGLYPDFDGAENAAMLIETQFPHWWVRAAWFR